MVKEKINLEEITALTKELFHAQYAGKPELWFAYLCADSIYLGTGEELLFGGDAIRARFKGFHGKRAEIVQENYFPIPLNDTTAQVCGQIIVQRPGGTYRAVTYFTICYRIIDGEIRMIHQHNSYEYMWHGKNSTLKLDSDTLQFVRSLLLKAPERKRMPVRSGTQTVFINPYNLMYVQSQRKKTSLVCVDCTVSCNSPIGELARELPRIFYPLHRGYLVNILYIAAIRRFEVELISGVTLPIPAMTYKQVKQDLEQLLQNDRSKG